MAQAAGSPASEQGQTRDYAAFLSYAHRDKEVTTAIQKGFRDDTDLAANPDLWGKIKDALDRSAFMIVVLSPNAAASQWVARAFHCGSAGDDGAAIVAS